MKDADITSSTSPQTNGRTSWPIGWYLTAMALSFGVLVFIEPWLNEWLNKGTRTIALYGLAMLLILRLVVAIKRRERNEQGQIYIAFMLLLPALWYVLEMFLLPALQRWMR